MRPDHTDRFDFGDMLREAAELRIDHGDHVLTTDGGRIEIAAPAGDFEVMRAAAIAGMVGASLARQGGRVCTVAFPVSQSYTGAACFSIQQDDSHLHADEVIA